MSPLDTPSGSPAAARAPATIVGLGVLAVVFLLVPLGALTLRAPWRRLPSLATDPAVLAALRLSIVTSLVALVIAAALGVPLAWLLARRRFPGAALVRSLAVLPMVLPPVVAGVALLLAFGRRGIIGGPLHDATGLAIPFTTLAVVLAQAFVALPFVVVTVEAGLRASDRRLEEAAATLGARRWTLLRRITLPMVAPSLAAGLGLAWARAIGEFGATITFAGNLPGRTQTMPLAVYLLLESDPAAATLLSLALLALSVLVLVSLRGPWLVER